MSRPAPQPDEPLFLVDDDGDDVLPALVRLKDCLAGKSFDRTMILPRPGGPMDVIVDPVNLVRAVQRRANLLEPSAAAGLFTAAYRLVDRSAAGLHRLFHAGCRLPRAEAAALLSPSLLDDLVDARVLTAAGDEVYSEVQVAAFEGRLYLSDPVRLQNHDDYCYLGRSSFVIPEFLHGTGLIGRGGPDSRLLDVGCGVGPSGIALASSYGHVVGSDVVERCLRFGRLNAALNDVANTTFVNSDVYDQVEGTFDVVISNTPCIWDFAEPGRPRTYASGGGDYGLELPGRIITGALERLRPGGVVLAVITGPILDGEPYVVRALRQMTEAAPARVVLHRILEEFEYRNAREYRQRGISKFVRYLAVLAPAEEFSVSFRNLDTPRLLSTRARTMPPRVAAAVTGMAHARH